MNKNNGKRWSEEEIAKLKELEKGNTPTRIIGLKLGRTPEAVQAKATVENISLKPNNRPPYGTKKKK